jgi:hypothetical protein
LDGSVQHRDLSAFGGLSPRGGFETTSKNNALNINESLIWKTTNSTESNFF